MVEIRSAGSKGGKEEADADADALCTSESGELPPEMKGRSRLKPPSKSYQKPKDIRTTDDVLRLSGAKTIDIITDFWHYIR